MQTATFKRPPIRPSVQKCTLRRPFNARITTGPPRPVCQGRTVQAVQLRLISSFL